jgi:bifunctional DNA-binding transcriptional regulator/antitoxin component of YhaV-PrlF toxin-antitoxin module
MNMEIKVQNISKINTLNTGQVLITMPKAIAHALKLKKGDQIEWLFDKGDLIVRKL